MTRTLVAVLLMILITSLRCLAQDTLPRFTVTTRGNEKVLISWTNRYPVVSQISIQRSSDSLRNFKTILTVPDPKVPQNGFVDTKAATPFMFYRLFIVLDSGKYIFSKPKRPFWDTSKIIEKTPSTQEVNKRVVLADNVTPKQAEQIQEKLEQPKKEDSAAVTGITPPKPEPEKFFYIKKRDSVVMEVAARDFKNFRDSIVNRTRDTMVFKNVDTVVLRPFIPKEVYKPSKYVFAEKDGNVTIALPEAGNKHYSVKFFEETEDTPLFEIKHLKEASMIIDKVNFMHAGWFRFELYEDGKLKEKHKLFIPKDF